MYKCHRKFVWAVATGCLMLSTGKVTYGGNWNVPTEAQNLLNPTEITEETKLEGTKIYREHCVACHGENGLGDGPEQKVEYSLQSVLATLVTPGNTPISDGELYWKVTHGVAKMPSFAGVLTDTERWLLINHIRLLPDE